MKKYLLITILALFAACLTIFLSVHFYKESLAKEPVKIVKDFFDLCADGKIEEARLLTSKSARVDKNSTIDVSIFQGKGFDWTHAEDMSKRQYRVQEVLDTTVGKYRTSILVLVKDSKEQDAKLTVCLSKEIGIDNWKINDVRYYDDSGILEEPSCV